MSQSDDMTRRLEVWDSLPRPVVTPSILACDFTRMDQEFQALQNAGVQAVHLDVMDGHFVPNLTYGPPVIRSWRPRTSLVFDAHLMISDPARYLDAYIDAGVDLLTFHIEAVPEPVDLLRAIRRRGCRAGLSLNPATPFLTIRPFLAEVDSVLVMSVVPGFGGQSFQPAVLEKVRSIRACRPALEIAIDGGINEQTASSAVQAGATQLVAGSAVFQGGPLSYAAALGAIAQAAARRP